MEESDIKLVNIPDDESSVSLPGSNVDAVSDVASPRKRGKLIRKRNASDDEDDEVLNDQVLEKNTDQLDVEKLPAVKDGMEELKNLRETRKERLRQIASQRKQEEEDKQNAEELNHNLEVDEDEKNEVLSESDEYSEVEDSEDERTVAKKQKQTTKSIRKVKKAKKKTTKGHSDKASLSGDMAIYVSNLILQNLNDSAIIHKALLLLENCDTPSPMTLKESSLAKVLLKLVAQEFSEDKHTVVSRSQAIVSRWRQQLSQ